jgi:hypothetical protein
MFSFLVFVACPNPTDLVALVGGEPQFKRAISVKEKSSVQASLDKPVTAIQLKILQHNLG